jgi:hypothetical protein
MPAASLKVVADMPELGQGETAEKPIPAPNASSTNVKAAAVTPPAVTAAQETADWSFAGVLDAISVLDTSVMLTTPAYGEQRAAVDGFPLRFPEIDGEVSHLVPQQTSAAYDPTTVPPFG